VKVEMTKKKYTIFEMALKQFAIAKDEQNMKKFFSRQLWL
jgi:hypothetical protein